MDTGHNDRNPFTDATNMTSVAGTEEIWMKRKITNNQDRKTILLSSPTFSAFGSVGRINGQDYAYNPENDVGRWSSRTLGSARTSVYRSRVKSASPDAGRTNHSWGSRPVYSVDVHCAETLVPLEGVSPHNRAAGHVASKLFELRCSALTRLWSPSLPNLRCQSVVRRTEIPFQSC
jgi:hypothetical protein